MPPPGWPAPPPPKRGGARGLLIGGSLAALLILILIGLSILGALNDEPGSATASTGTSGDRVAKASGADIARCEAALRAAASDRFVDSADLFPECQPLNGDQRQAALSTIADVKPPEPAPLPADFQLTIKTLDKQCFGSAGCNVTYRVLAGWTKVLDPARTYEVTYQVRGLEDTAIGTMEVTGDEYRAPDEEIGSTTNSSKKLTAVVLQVEEVNP